MPSCVLGLPFSHRHSLRLCLVAQSCLTLCELTDCSPPGSSVQGIFQARTLEHCHCLLRYSLPISHQRLVQSRQKGAGGERAVHRDALFMAAGVGLRGVGWNGIAGCYPSQMSDTTYFTWKSTFLLLCKYRQGHIPAGSIDQGRG